MQQQKINDSPQAFKNRLLSSVLAWEAIDVSLAYLVSRFFEDSKTLDIDDLLKRNSATDQTGGKCAIVRGSARLCKTGDVWA